MDVLKKIIFTAFVVLTALSLGLIGAAQGAYRTEWKGSFEARVAGFDVEVSLPALVGTRTVLSADDPLEEVQYAVVVTNQSEVTVKYEASVQNVENHYTCSVTPASGVLLENGGEITLIVSVGIRDAAELPTEDLSGMELYIVAEQLD